MKDKHNSHYRMQGMGTLLSMYGQAGNVTENEALAAKSELKDIDRELANEKNPERQKQLVNAKKQALIKYKAAKDRMKQLLLGAAETAAQAATALDTDAHKSSLSNHRTSKTMTRRLRKSPAPSVSTSESD